MKYIFEKVTNFNDPNAHNIKITVGGDNPFGTVNFTISSNDGKKWDYECPEILHSLLDELRFSVKERQDAENDLNEFLEFLYGSLLETINSENEPSDDKEQMILENTEQNGQG